MCVRRPLSISVSRFSLKTEIGKQFAAHSFDSNFSEWNPLQAIVQKPFITQNFYDLQTIYCSRKRWQSFANNSILSHCITQYLSKLHHYCTTPIKRKIQFRVDGCNTHHLAVAVVRRGSNVKCAKTWSRCLLLPRLPPPANRRRTKFISHVKYSFKKNERASFRLTRFCIPLFERAIQSPVGRDEG